MENNYKQIDVLGGTIQYNKTYTNKDNKKVQAAIRLGMSGMKFPQRLNKDIIQKIWALKDDKDFMKEVFASME